MRKQLNPNQKVVRCNLCQENISVTTTTCERPKNGYCAIFRLQAEIDAKKANMHKPKNRPT